MDYGFYNDHDTTKYYETWPGAPDLATWGYHEGGELSRGYYDGIACGMLSTWSL